MKLELYGFKAVGIVEEITMNATSATAALAAEIPKNYNYNFDLPVKDQIIKTISLADLKI